MIKGIGYTVWIEPPYEVSNHYKKIIEELAEEFGTEEFIPHITLLGAMKISKGEAFTKAERLAKLVKPFEIELTGEIFCHDSQWSRSMIILERKTPELIKLYDLARDVFQYNPGDFLPHLSLMYSEDIPLSIRAERAKRLQNKDLKFKFEVDKFHLVLTEGTPSEWARLKDFPLEG